MKQLRRSFFLPVLINSVIKTSLSRLRTFGLCKKKNYFPESDLACNCIFIMSLIVIMNRYEGECGESRSLATNVLFGKCTEMFLLFLLELLLLM